GHEWLATNAVVPVRCANSKCRAAYDPFDFPCSCIKASKSCIKASKSLHLTLTPDCFLVGTQTTLLFDTLSVPHAPPLRLTVNSTSAFPNTRSGIVKVTSYAMLVSP